MMSQRFLDYPELWMKVLSDHSVLSSTTPKLVS